MHFTLSTAVALLAAAATTVSALDKPLDIKVTKAVDCDRKTKTGAFSFACTPRRFLFLIEPLLLSSLISSWVATSLYQFMICLLRCIKQKARLHPL